MSGPTLLLAFNFLGGGATAAPAEVELDAAPDNVTVAHKSGFPSTTTVSHKSGFPSTTVVSKKRSSQ